MRPLHRLVNALRVLRLRASGASVERGVTVGRCVRCERGVVIRANAVLGDQVEASGNVRIGNGVRIERLVELRGNVTIGEGSVVGAFSILSTMPSGLLEIGKDVYVNAFSVIGAAQRVEIADHCIFAAYVQITDATHGIEDPDALTKNSSISAAPVRIEENVWLGSGAMVTKGVTVGRGAVVGAKALVRSDIPPMAVAYGIPARVVRSRSSEAGAQA